MFKNVHIRLIKVGASDGPFNIYDQFGNLIEAGVSRKRLIEGVSYILDSGVTMIRLVSTGNCRFQKVMSIKEMTEKEFYYDNSMYVLETGCIWRHLTDPTLFNSFYGEICQYVIEYPFAYKFYDQIIQNVKDYTRVYKYEIDTASSLPVQIELNDEWFNKAIVYNGQQCSGLLKLEVKPKRNLKKYMTYPIYGYNSKTIVFTKSDSYYQYNTFWDVVKDKSQALFTPSCENMSIDKVLNQDNHDYSKKSFTKATIRGKDTKVRHILDNSSSVHLVSKFIYTPTQISYK